MHEFLDELDRLRTTLCTYFCGGCGRTFRQGYSESPRCPHCGWPMPDVDPYRDSPYAPPGVQRVPRPVADPEPRPERGYW
jgi:hypothetical protein